MRRAWRIPLIAALALASPPASPFATPSAGARPEDVVAAVVRALGNPDSPAPNAGIYVAYRLASPANRRATGPYGRFLRLVRIPDFFALLHPDRDPAALRFDPLALHGDRAEQRVRVRSGGQWRAYTFTLTRQAGNAYQGAWMVDGVVPVPGTALPPSTNAAAP